MQSSFQLPRNSKHIKIFCYSYFTKIDAHILSMASAGDSFSNHYEQQCNGHTTMQLQQFVTGFQPSRTNSFDSNSCNELIQNFISKISNSEGASTPLSPRKWVKIRAVLKLASVGRLSRTSRRGPHCNPPRPRLVPII
jgi:hypothetical protein